MTPRLVKFGAVPASALPCLVPQLVKIYKQGWRTFLRDAELHSGVVAHVAGIRLLIQRKRSRSPIGHAILIPLPLS